MNASSELGTFCGHEYPRLVRSLSFIAVTATSHRSSHRRRSRGCVETGPRCGTWRHRERGPTELRAPPDHPLGEDTGPVCLHGSSLTTQDRRFQPVTTHDAKPKSADLFGVLIHANRPCGCITLGSLDYGPVDADMESEDAQEQT